VVGVVLGVEPHAPLQDRRIVERAQLVRDDDLVRDAGVAFVVVGRGERVRGDADRRRCGDRPQHIHPAGDAR